MTGPEFLPSKVTLSGAVGEKLRKVYEAGCANGFDEDFGPFALEQFGLDISSVYGGQKIKIPFGKASGQLSCTASQVASDARDGMGFVILKTVLAQDESGTAAMADWKIKAPRMLVERITSQSGKEGYTVTWKGRGWDKSFADYLAFAGESMRSAKEFDMPAIPSCTYHLPTGGEDYRVGEYEYTTRAFVSLWKEVYGDRPLMMEKDFSPTLSPLINESNQELVFDWITRSPKLIKKFAPDAVLGVKLMNTRFDRHYQLELLKTLYQAGDADYAVVFNRLFDFQKEFDGKVGVAYGGYDLSDKNLSVLDDYLAGFYAGVLPPHKAGLSATGNICSGLMMAEYALRGCANGQLHTYFQIPSESYGMKVGSRVRRALFELIFNPENGLAAAMLYLKEKVGINAKNDVTAFGDVTTFYQKENLFKIFKEIK